MRFRKQVHLDGSLGLAPLLDVVFLLLIFFLVTASFTTQRIPLDLPEATGAIREEPDSLEIIVDADGVMYFENQPVDLGMIESILADRASSTTLVVIHADEEARHGDVIRILDQVRRSEAGSVAIAVEQDRTAGVSP